MTWNWFISHLIFLISDFIFTILHVSKIPGYTSVHPFMFVTGMGRKKWPEISWGRFSRVFEGSILIRNQLDRNGKETHIPSLLINLKEFHA